MKKFLVAFSLLLLAAMSCAAGIFVAEKKFKSQSQKIIINDFRLDSIEAIAEENNVEVVRDEKELVEKNKEENPAEKIEFSFFLIGDSQYFKPGANGGYQQAIGSIKKLNPDLIFSLGDLVSSCDVSSECESKFNNWKSALGSLSSKTYVMQGNHDRTGKDKADKVWEKVFANLPANGPSGFTKFAYSFDFKNSHFIVLDSDKPKENDINETQLNWLDQDLAKNKKENNFVFFHEPAYPTNSKIGESIDENPGNRDRLWNILAKHKITAVFSGHEHIQARSKINGIYQFIFGNTDSFNHLAPKPGKAEYYHIGQGFGGVRISGQGVTVDTYSVSGKLLNSFVLPK